MRSVQSRMDEPARDMDRATSHSVDPWRSEHHHTGRCSADGYGHSRRRSPVRSDIRRDQFRTPFTITFSDLGTSGKPRPLQPAFASCSTGTGRPIYGNTKMMPLEMADGSRTGVTPRRTATEFPSRSAKSYLNLCDLGARRGFLFRHQGLRCLCACGREGLAHHCRPRMAAFGRRCRRHDRSVVRRVGAESLG